MSLRLRLLLTMLAALVLFFVPLSLITIRVARQAAESSLERAALARLGLLAITGGRVRALAGLVQEFGGTGFLERNGQVRFTDTGPHRIPQEVSAQLRAGRSLSLRRGNDLWIALPEGSSMVGLDVPLRGIATLPEQLLRLYLEVGLPTLLLVFLVGAVALSKATAPLSRLGQQLARRGPQDLSELAEPGLPELVPVVQSLNALLMRLSAALDRLKIQERSAREFAYRASHELRNPLAALGGYLQVLARHPAEPRALAGSQEQWELMQRLVDSLLQLARSEGRRGAQFSQVPLGELLACELAVDPVGEAWVLGEPELILLAARNLVENAERHGGGLLRVRIQSFPERQEVLLLAEDRGGQSPPEHPFDPFVKGGGSGTGLGLAIVASVAAAHGKQVYARWSSQGSSVGLYLPLAQGAPGEAER